MKKGNIACLSFSEKGRALANTIAAMLDGEAACTKDGVSLADWTAKAFAESSALVYVGAAGIAVRAIAPHLQSKTVDPAVIAVDECGHFAVSLLSGHLGGANELAETIAAICGGTAVITTATDRNDVFAADEWARMQGLTVVNPERIKRVSAKLLAGEPIKLGSAVPVDGPVPKGVQQLKNGSADIWVDIRVHDALMLVPPVLALGIGCRRGTAKETLEKRFAAFCAETGLLPEAIYAVATIDLKRDEKGLGDFCASHGWPLNFCTAEELAAVEGHFTASGFVARTAGVDNVCERAAVKLAQGDLIAKKFAGEGVTFALAQKPAQLDWRWHRG